MTTKRVRHQPAGGEKPGPDEPIGIVISRGSQAEDPPRFAAYVWGPVPEPVTSAELTAVA